MSKKRQHRQPKFPAGGMLGEAEELKWTAITRAGVFAAPWTITVTSALGTQVAHFYWGGDPTVTPFVALAIGGTGSAITALVRKLTEGTNRIRRDLYTVNTAALTAGCTVGMVTGLGQPAVLKAWIIGGIALSAATSIRRLLGSEKTEQSRSKWSRLEDKLKLEAYTVRNEAGTGKGTVTADVSAKDGATVDELQRKVPALTSAMGLGKGRVTVTEDPEDASRAQFRATVADLLKDPIPWQPPTALGGSIVDPIPVSRYEDGEDLDITLPGTVPARGEIEHLLLMGTTGAGKTEFGRSVVTRILTRRDVHVIVIDTAKGNQYFGAIRHGLTLFITDPELARQLFKVLPTVIKNRTDHLGTQGLKGWTPGCGLSFLAIWGEEAADYAADSGHYDELLRKARSAGIWIATSLQRATYQNLSTDARANHGASACFGVRDPEDASFALPDEVTDAGAIPSWGARKPGYHYFVGMGAPEDRWTMPLRGPITDDRVLADVVSHANAYREPLDPITAHGLGAVYQNRTIYTEPLLPGGPAGNGSENQPATGVAAPEATGPIDPDSELSPDAPDIEEIDMSDDDVAREVSELREMLSDLAAMDPEPDENYGDLDTADDDLPSCDPDTPLDLRRDRSDAITADQAREELYAQLDTWVTQGRSTFTPNDLKDIWMRYDGDGRRWFYRERDALIDQAVIAEADDYGSYDLLRSPHDNKE